MSRINDLVVTIRDTTRPEGPPLLVTGGARVIWAVLDAVVESVEGGPVRRRALRLAHEAEPEAGEPDTDPGGRP